MTEILNQFHEDELPPSRVDIAQAVRSGRRRRRAQAGLVAGGVVLGLVAGGVVLGLAAGGATAPVSSSAPPSHGGPSAVATCSGGPLPAYTQGAAWQTFDPLRYEIDASGVTGYQISGYSTARYFQVLTLTNPAGTRRVTVTLYATEGVPHYLIPHTSMPTPGPNATSFTSGVPEPIDPAAGEPTDPVGGAPAYWLPDQDGLDPNEPGAGPGLAWQWTLGGWAFVTALALDPTSPKPPINGDPTELRALATQVAGQLVLGSGTPVTSPFSMPVPACTRVDSTSLMFGTKSDGTPFARFGLGFATADRTEPSNPLLLPGDSGRVITIDADTGETPADKPGSATSEVDGYPAYDQGTFLVVYGPLTVEISTPGSPEGMNTAAPSLVDPRVLYSSMQIRPGATADPATWGTPIG